MFNGSVVYGIHIRKVVEHWKGNRKMALDPRDSRRKDNLITGRRILIDIQDRKNKVRRKIFGKMLKKGQQKSSTRLCDRVIVRKRVKNKIHNHVQKPRTFCKVRIVCELSLTPIRRVLTKSRFELIFGHSPQTLTTKVVRKLYPKDTKHIGDQLWCDNNVRTSRARMDM